MATTNLTGVSPNFIFDQAGAWTVALTVRDVAGRTSTATKTVTVNPSTTTLPAEVTGLAATVSGLVVTLRWDPVSDSTVTGIRLYRSEVFVEADTVSIFPPVLIATVAAGATSTTDSPPKTGTIYQYSVRSINAAGLESRPSAVVEASISTSFVPALQSLSLDLTTLSNAAIGSTTGNASILNGNLVLKSDTTTRFSSLVSVPHQGVGQAVIAGDLSLMQFQTGTGEFTDSLSIEINATTRAVIQRYVKNDVSPVIDLLRFRIVENNVDPAMQTMVTPLVAGQSAGGLSSVRAFKLALLGDGRTISFQYSLDYTEATENVSATFKLGVERQFSTALLLNSQSYNVVRATNLTLGTGTPTVSTTGVIKGTLKLSAGTSAKGNNARLFNGSTDYLLSTLPAAGVAEPLSVVSVVKHTTDSEDAIWGFSTNNTGTPGRYGYVGATSSPLSTLRPLGTPIMSDSEAASHVRRHGWEPRPENATANNKVPTSAEISAFLAASGTQLSASVRNLVTGNSTLPGPSGTPYNTAVLADAPFAYVRFEETSTATSTAGGTLTNAGTNTGLAVTSESPFSTLQGLPNTTGAITGLSQNNAKTFNTNARALIASSTALDIWAGAWTLEFWFKRSATQGTTQTIFRKASAISVQFNTSNELVVTNQSTTQDSVKTNSAITDQNWHHCVIRKAASATANPTIRIDKVDVTSVVTSGTTWANAATTFVTFGGGTTASQGFSGSLDEWALYNTAISDSRADVHYNSGVTAATLGPSTDELIQWAAWKWGLPEDTLRAEAVHESSWIQSAAGDQNADGSFASWGLMQIKGTNTDGATPFNWKGTYPLSSTSTAFNLDFYGAVIRDFLEGRAQGLGAAYTSSVKNDMTQALGYWFSGGYNTTGGNSYATGVLADQTNRVWENYPGYNGQNTVEGTSTPTGVTFWKDAAANTQGGDQDVKVPLNEWCVVVFVKSVGMVETSVYRPSTRTWTHSNDVIGPLPSGAAISSAGRFYVGIPYLGASTLAFAGQIAAAGWSKKGLTIAERESLINGDGVMTEFRAKAALSAGVNQGGTTEQAHLFDLTGASGPFADKIGTASLTVGSGTSQATDTGNVPYIVGVDEGTTNPITIGDPTGLTLVAQPSLNANPTLVDFSVKIDPPSAADLARPGYTLVYYRQEQESDLWIQIGTSTTAPTQGSPKALQVPWSENITPVAVRAVATNEASDLSTPILIVSPAQAKANMTAPTGFVLVAGDRRIDALWDPNPANQVVTGYRLYIKFGGGAYGLPVYDGPGIRDVNGKMTAPITNLTNGVTYTVKVVPTREA